MNCTTGRCACECLCVLCMYVSFMAREENTWTPWKILIYCRWTTFLRCTFFFYRFSAGNWITRLTQNKCVNGFSSKIKRNVIKMMSLRQALHIHTHTPRERERAHLVGLPPSPLATMPLAKYSAYFSNHKFYFANFLFPRRFSRREGNSLMWRYRFLVLNIKWIRIEIRVWAKENQKIDSGSWRVTAREAAWNPLNVNCITEICANRQRNLSLLQNKSNEWQYD